MKQLMDIEQASYDRVQETDFRCPGVGFRMCGAKTIESPAGDIAIDTPPGFGLALPVLWQPGSIWTASIQKLPAQTCGKDHCLDRCG
jgi:hypothetical protein